MAFGDLTQKWHGQYYRIPPQITYVFVRTVAHVCSKFDKAHQKIERPMEFFAVTGRICQKLLPGGWLKWNAVVNSLAGMTF